MSESSNNHGGRVSDNFDSNGAASPESNTNAPSETEAGLFFDKPQVLSHQQLAALRQAALAVPASSPQYAIKIPSASSADNLHPLAQAKSFTPQEVNHLDKFIDKYSREQLEKKQKAEKLANFKQRNRELAGKVYNSPKHGLKNEKLPSATLAQAPANSFFRRAGAWVQSLFG